VGRFKGDMHHGTSTPAQIRSSFGGVARNVSENLARLGQPVNLITAVGDDEDGLRLLQGLRLAGVNTDSIICTSQYATGSYLAIVDAHGDLQFALDDMRAINSLTPNLLRSYANMFKGASLLFVDGNLPKETLRTILSVARKKKLPVCADPTSQELAIKLIPHLKHLRLVVPNSGEAAILCGQQEDINSRREAIEAAKCLVSRGVEIAIITMAESGVCYATSETSGFVPPVKTHIIDPTGAGDALTAAVLFGIINQMPVDDAVKLGVAAASLTLTYRGAVVPDLSLEKIYDQLR